MTPKQMIDFADQLATQLVDYANRHEVCPRDLLMASSLGVHMLQAVYPGTNDDKISVLQEASATFAAHCHELVVN